MCIDNHQLWYRQSAATWNEALPVGNGRIGAMLFGGAADARIQINEDTLWTGMPMRYENPNAHQALKKARALSLQGDQKGAQDVLEQEFCTGLWSQMYMPLCDLHIRMPAAEHVTDYTRRLDMQRGVHTVRFTLPGGQTICRETFVSHPEQALIVRIHSENKGKITLSAALAPALQFTELQADAENGLLLTGHCPVVHHTKGVMQGGGAHVDYSDDPAQQGMGYAARLTAHHEGGSLCVSADGLSVRDADAVTLIFTARTSFAGWDRHPVLEGREYMQTSLQDALNAKNVPFETLLRRHTEDHRSLYDQIELDIPGDDEIAALPTDERMRRHQAGQRENGLYVLCFNHARYLTVSGSRAGTQPMNLQGIWNDSDNPPWHCNYTLNINTEMNYWPTLRMGLDDCMQPMLALIRDLTESGKWSAGEYYGAGGACAHHNTDLWRMATPVGAGCHMTAEFAFWPFGLAWLCRSGWEYYLYTRDEAALADIVLPALQASARFLLDTVIEDKSEWIFCPATSAEHWYRSEKGDCQVDRTSGMMQQMTRDVWEMCLEAEKAAGKCMLSAEIMEKLPCLKGLEKDSHGRIAEFDGDRRDGEDEHRHVSHLYALFPAQQITPDMPEWTDAVRRTLDMRGDESTGWAMAWRINLWARLRDGNRALKLLSNQLMLCRENDWQSGGTYPNLFCAHPPLQIDGNFGAASGILEMLCQVEKDGSITLLPALPDAWKNGSVKGLRLPGRRVLNMTWQQGRVTHSEILQA